MEKQKAEPIVDNKQNQKRGRGRPKKSKEKPESKAVNSSVINNEIYSLDPSADF